MFAPEIPHFDVVSLLIIILAVFASHRAAELPRMRQPGWLRTLTGWLYVQRQRWPLAAGIGALLVLYALPLGAVFLLLNFLSTFWYGWAEFLVSVAILIYCWGPRDLDRDVAHCLKVNEGDLAEGARLRLIAGHPGAGEQPTSLVVLGAALERWFGPILWFLALGPMGALLYRMTQQLANREELGARLSTDQAETVQYLLFLLNFPVAWAMTLSLAVIGHFDSVLGAGRRHVAEHGTGWLSCRLDVLYVTARPSLLASLETAGKDSDLESADAVSMALAMAWRILFLWLTLLAVFVLAGWLA
ncbi:MAG: membrane protein [Lysobacteraceae bacterium]|nr:MAG: membrane protein [Xanthomonadaceae bacterium]